MKKHIIDNKGFTLLEMVIVVAIIAMLFLLTVPNIQTVLGIVGDKSCDAQVKVVDSAILQYELLKDETPTSVDELISEGLLNESQSECSGKTISISNGQAYAD